MIIETRNIALKLTFFLQFSDMLVVTSTKKDVKVHMMIEDIMQTQNLSAMGPERELVIRNTKTSPACLVFE